MKHILGVSAGYHDAAISVVREDGKIVFAGHSERYSKIKNDPELSAALVDAAYNFDIDTIAYYERPWMHNIQQMRSGENDFGPWTVKGVLEQHLGTNRIRGRRLQSFSHHLSHAAAGFQTSPYHEAAVVVIDAIGELDTISIYQAYYDTDGHARYEKVWGQRYPHSIGLFYSALTDAVGLKPQEEEYITMGMAAYGKNPPIYELAMYAVEDYSAATFRDNFHVGFHPDVFATIGDMNAVELAAAGQFITEKLIQHVIQRAAELTGSDNLVYMGGVALNCLANSRLGEYFENIWIMPNPGDAGSSLGAAALALGRRLNWCSPYLGYDIPGPYPVDAALDALLTTGICGVASGAAEFGPRALGNRSLLADPRGPEIKDRVNDIKRRQRFRPFAPVILAEYADQYFDLPRGFATSPYMQSVACCRSPDVFPAIVHVDGTSRVQTVAKDCPSGIRQLLEAWHAATGCPMLLNTSLNIRGEPMVNNCSDADRFELMYGIKVFS
jgi:carbamoyltransferase